MAFNAKPVSRPTVTAKPAAPKNGWDTQILAKLGVIAGGIEVSVEQSTYTKKDGSETVYEPVLTFRDPKSGNPKAKGKLPFSLCAAAIPFLQDVVKAETEASAPAKARKAS